MSTPPEHPQQRPHDGAAPPPPPPGATPPPPGATPPPPGATPPPAPAGPAAPPPGYGPSGGYGGSPAYGSPGSGPVVPLSPADQRTWAVLAHLGGVFFSFVAPLVVWLVFRGRGAFLEHQAKEALNFQVTLVLAFLAGTVLSVVGIGVLILVAAWIGGIVLAILGAVAAGRGEPYRYPVSLRLVT